MALKLTDDMYSHLAPPETVEFRLDGGPSFPRVAYPADGTEPIVLALKWAGGGSAFEKALRAGALKAPLPDPIENTERTLRLFVKTAIAGYRNVFDDGKQAAYDAKFCADLLVHVLRQRGLQGIQEVEALMGFAASPMVFRRAAPASADDLGKE